MTVAPEADLDIPELTLDVVSKAIVGLDTRVDNSVVDGSLERTIEGASTLSITVHDPKRALLLSGMFSFAIDVRLDRLYFRLVQVTKSDDALTLTFEDRQVAYLRKYTKPRKVARSKMTRAEFALSLVREVKEGGGIKFVCPQLHVKQATDIEAANQRRTPPTRAAARQKGLPRKAKLMVKGRPATPAQKAMAERLLDVADSMGAPPKAAQALVEAAIVESGLANLAGGDRDSRGVLQVRDSTARGMRLNNRDPEAVAAAFLKRGYYGKGGAIQLARQHPDWSAGRIAQAVQGSAFPERYDQVGGDARQFVRAYGGTGTDDGTLDLRSTDKSYQFRRGVPGDPGPPEDSWTCLKRLADEVQWRCFMSAGAVYFISETELMKSKPRLVLSEDDPAVLGIDFDVDNGKVTSEVTVTARATRWFAAPGAVCELEDCGPADGRWLVSSISRGLFDATATITLKRPTQPLPEPTESSGGSDATGVQAAGKGAGGYPKGSAVARAYAMAMAISKKRLPYVWGGGHGKAGQPSGGGYDCSGAVVAVLAAAGLGFKPGGKTATSGALENWGAPGKGEGMTVYANGTHTFIVFEGVGQPPHDVHFGTGDWGKGWGGAGLNPRMHPTAGFTARHYPGT